MKIEITATHAKELKLALKDKNNAVHHRKLQALILRSEGKSLVAIGESVGFVHQTVRNLINRYLEGGLPAILNENRGGRRRYYMTLEEEQAFLQEEFKGALDGKHITIQSLYDAYQVKVGKKTTREGFYALLKRHGWRKVEPRPEHPKKADAQVIETSKNKIFLKESEEALST